MAHAVSKSEFDNLKAEGKLQPGTTYRVSTHPDKSGIDEEAYYLKATSNNEATIVKAPDDDPGVKWEGSPYREGHWYTR